MKTHRLLLFIVEGEKCVFFFLKKMRWSAKKSLKNKTYSKNWLLIQFHLLCANFRKFGWQFKKKAKFGDGPLKRFLFDLPHLKVNFSLYCYCYYLQCKWFFYWFTCEWILTKSSCYKEYLKKTTEPQTNTSSEQSMIRTKFCILQTASVFEKKNSWNPCNWEHQPICLA